MKKWLALFFVFLLMLGSFAGYLFITEKIIAGNIKIAEGQKQLAEGEKMLARGKAKLARGEGALAKAKDANKGLTALPLLGVIALPVTAGVYMAGNKKISEGDRQVAIGKEKIKAGEKQLTEGKLELNRGIAKIAFANKIRIACASSAIFFGVLELVLVFCWRRTIISALRRQSV